MLIKKVVTPVVIVAASLGAMAVPSISFAEHDEAVSIYPTETVYRTPDGRELTPAPQGRGARESLPVPSPTYRVPPAVPALPTAMLPQFPQQYAQPVPQTYSTLPQFGYGTAPFVPTSQPTAHAPSPMYTGVRVPQRGHESVSFNHAPPQPRHEYTPAARRGFIWVPGFWDVQGHHYVWVEGYFERERRGYAFQHQRWEHRGDGWFLNRARFDRAGARFPNQFDRDGDRVPDHHDREPLNPRRF